MYRWFMRNQAAKHLPPLSVSLITHQSPLENNAVCCFSNTGLRECGLSICAICNLKCLN
jgi:hypothetical protein